MKAVRSVALSLIATCLLASSQIEAGPTSRASSQYTSPANDTDGAPLGACPGCFNTGNEGLSISKSDPLVHLKQGTYAGRRQSPIDGKQTLSGFDTHHSQEHFLGIPYAKPPVGDARYRRAKKPDRNQTSNDILPAKQYSLQCMGVGGDSDYAPPYVTYALGEDCLTVNVIRPANTSSNAKLPVWTFIHGGGFYQGGAADRRYNASWIVDRSVEMGQPIVFVSLQYRLDSLGFPVGNDAKEEGLYNLGLYDQRLALEWIHDNIEAFGGDKDKVTIMGESAGGASILVHYTAHDAQEKRGLFRSGISHSGYFAVQSNSDEARESRMNALQKALGCDGESTAKDRMDCLRAVDFARYAAAERKLYKEMPVKSFGPQVDGEIIPRDIETSFEQGKFLPRPLIAMANSDEGSSFGDATLNNTAQIFAGLDKQGFLSLTKNVTQEQRDDIEKLYPDDEDRYCPYSAGDGFVTKTGGGLMGRRDRGIIGDSLMVGPRRRVSELVSAKADVYAARFDQVPYKGDISVGVGHFYDMASTFSNPLDTQNALGPNSRRTALAKEMTTYWVSFVATGSPNAHKMSSSPSWPKYDTSSPKDLRLTNRVHGVKTQVEEDTWRKEGIKLLMDFRKEDHQ
ncbi:unnamed protein product [Sympodiomycopsis kandeliae]